MAGSGTLILNSSESQAATTVSSGSLDVDGTLTGTVSAAGSTIVEGDGTIQGSVSVSNGATITGGDGLTIPGKLTAPPTINGTLNVYLNGTNAGTTYDQIATTGSSPVVLARTPI